MGFPTWAKNREYVYLLHEENQPSVMRVHLRDRKIERVADLKDFRQGGFYSVWLGIAPDDSPLHLERHGHTRNLCSRLADPVIRPLRFTTIEFDSLEGNGQQL
jgi:hypothetical protein